MDKEDIQRYLDDCENVRNIIKENGGPGFTKWEKDFLDSVKEQFDDQGKLPYKQARILKEMWNRI